MQSLLFKIHKCQTTHAVSVLIVGTSYTIRAVAGGKITSRGQSYKKKYEKRSQKFIFGQDDNSELKETNIFASVLSMGSLIT